jgi:two-component system sensor histidine kinase BaeS
MNNLFKTMRSRIIASHIALSFFCVATLSIGFVYYMEKYFADFLSKLQVLLDGNKGQIPKGQIISSLGIANEYMRLMDIGVVIGAVLSIIAAVIIGILIADQLSKPLRLFTKAIHQLKETNYAQIQTPYTGELAELKVAYNELSCNLHELQNIRKHLVANVGHELKTPLTALQGYIEGLEDGLINFDKTTSKDMSDEIARLKNLVNDFETSTLDYSAILQLTSVDVGSFFNDLHNYFFSLIKDNQLRLQINHDTEKYKMLFDPDRMKQALIILVENAIKFTSPGGLISITYFKQNQQFQVIVADNGCGIGESDLPYIFERFYRGDKSRSRKTGGIGIGLSIAREIIQAHGGKIDVQSQSGKGTQFSIHLPVK